MDEKKMIRIVQQAIDHRLSGLEENPFLAQRIIASEKGAGSSMKPRKRRSAAAIFAVTVVIGLLLASTAVAAVKLGVLSLFTLGGQANESAVAGVQALAAEYLGSSVCFMVNEAIYDKAGGSYSLGFTVENLEDDDRLYVYCDGVYFDGERSHIRTELNYTEYILPLGVSEGVAMGELPERADGVCEMRYTILRGLCPFVETASGESDFLEQVREIRENGGIPIDVDGWIYTDGNEELEISYAESLLETGQFEIADQFALRVVMDEKLLGETKKTYTGQKRFDFDGYALEIVEAYTTPTTAHIEVAYITDAPQKPDGEEGKPSWRPDFTAPGHELWSGSADGAWTDPVQLEDGRYQSVYRFKAQSLFVQPDEILMTLVTYDDRSNPTRHDGDAVTLSFQ